MALRTGWRSLSAGLRHKGDLPGREVLSTKEGRRSFLLDDIVPKVGIRDVGSPSEWKKLDSTNMKKAGGGPLLARYNGSILAMMRDLLPEYHWDPRLCRAKVPQGYWEDSAKRREFLEEVARDCCVTKPEDWKNVSVSDVLSRGGGALLKKFGFSLIAALRDTFPEQQFSEIDSCKSVPRGYWRRKDNRRELMQRVALKCAIKEPSDWGRVTNEDIRAAGGATLLGRASLHDLILDAFPEVSEEDLGKRPRGFWEEQANRRSFLCKFAERNGLRSIADWVSVTVKDMHDAGAGGLLVRYSNNIELMLRDLMPELFDEGRDSWHSSSRKFVRAAFWQEPENVRAFLDHVANYYRVQSEDDWARISVRQINALQGGGLLRQMTLPAALRLAYPTKRWGGLEVRVGGKKSDQRQLMLTIASIFEIGTSGSCPAEAGRG